MLNLPLEMTHGLELNEYQQRFVFSYYALRPTKEVMRELFGPGKLSNTPFAKGYIDSCGTDLDWLDQFDFIWLPERTAWNRRKHGNP